MQIQDPGWKKFGSGMEKSRIRIGKNIPDQQYCGEYRSNSAFLGEFSTKTNNISDPKAAL
jgi:hypothetical protein